MRCDSNWGNNAGLTRVESSGEVAARIVGLIVKPVAEMSTNPAVTEMVGAYFKDVGAFKECLAKRARGEAH